MPSNTLKILLFITLCIGFRTATNAQTEVSGQVNDDFGPLPGVSIVVEVNLAWCLFIGVATEGKLVHIQLVFHLELLLA